MSTVKNSEFNFAWIFILIPTILVIFGILFFPYPLKLENRVILNFFLFMGLILLGIGSYLKKDDKAKIMKIIGWILFSFYWSTQINSLYFSEQGDFVNAFICITGIYILFYIAYHEWLSLKRNENIECINWIAGASAIAGLIYFIIELTPLATWLIEIVAKQSGWLLDIFTDEVSVNGRYISYKLAHIRIIFACTAVQSIVLFVGMILPLKKVHIKRKIYGLTITVIPIYFLNLIRNAGITYMVGIYDNDFFNIAHNIIGKGGSLIALIILLFIVIKIVPEVFDEIINLTELHKRNGPIEKIIKKYIGVKIK
jgi:archaeosortase A (PGF-CTERM-specific)